jgi:hypothetical protein
MPFELGLTIGLERSAHPNHSWIVCETVPHRIKKSLSDLDGTDAYIHGGTVAGDSANWATPSWGAVVSPV